jgi:EpsD family peptidyl-prolyl cis-trans isomerase
MNLRPIRTQVTYRPRALVSLAVLSSALFALSLVGCGERKPEKTGSQTAAKVNREEITVHQLNLLLQRQRGLKPEQLEMVSKQALEALIDQELAVQKTRELKIDQDPRVMLQLEAAKREVLARAYADRATEGAVKPSAVEIQNYYESRPELFKERRIYTLQELAIEAKPEQVTALREQLKQSKSVGELVEYLKISKLKFAGSQGVLAAEQAPMDALQSLVKMKDGQMILVASPAGATAIMLVSSRAEPVEPPAARPVIEQFLINEIRRKRNEADVKSLRAAAKIEYMGKFAETAASGAFLGLSSGASSGASVGVGAAKGQAQSSAGMPSPSVSASGISSADISKGLGIKK